MRKQAKKSALIEVIYILILVLIALVITLLGMFFSTKSITKVFNNYELVLVVFFFIFAFLLLMYVYQIKIIKKKVDCTDATEFSITFTIIPIVVLISCLLYSYYSPYAIPISAISLLLAIMLRQRIGIMGGIISFMMILMLGPITHYYLTPETMNIDSFGILVSLSATIIMPLLVHKGFSRLKLTWGAILVSLVFIPLGCLISFLGPNATIRDIILAGVESFVGNLIGVGIVTLLLPLYEVASRVWTDFKLSEVCSQNTKILRKLREEAPGTYSHSLIVANMVETCAITLGLNPFMARACAMYHDIGKINSPEFFVENQEGGYNPHDELIIDMSVKIITDHTQEGAEILKAYRMPDTVIKAALEHHGTSALMYFYMKAKGITEGDLDDDRYRYSGPKPTTKYSAVLMICDVCEAMTRAKPPESMQELENAVEKVIKDRVMDGQFSECDISLKELDLVKQTICEVIPSILHKRIDYNKAKEIR